ncbi:helix-turn-helix domain-containing protein [Halorarum halophilum]|uniref:Helix-turn-helix domain-containing protein n=1 Tax=Halorarum halophilum TaxID=2743090 RepID=A0A7D5KNX6_9EURY|nr:winged helix-turn-helix domain-containing protein [Halobaculum halophilum]QLG28902.1 helix-turn-helix domain-containing protein [Halobaculum halophilum]
MSVEVDPAEVLGLLYDEYARSILMRTSSKPMSADQLADACDASISTVYRRVDELEELGLIHGEEQYDPNGDHYRTFEAVVDHVGIDIEDGDLSVTMSRSENRADRFTRAWENLREDE